MWGGLFSTFDCTLVAVRKKEDPWNSIAAGAMTGGLALGGLLVVCFKGSLLRGLQKLRVRHQSAGPDFSLFY